MYTFCGDKIEIILIFLMFFIILILFCIVLVTIEAV